MANFETFNSDGQWAYYTFDLNLTIIVNLMVLPNWSRNDFIVERHFIAGIVLEYAMI